MLRALLLPLCLVAAPALADYMDHFMVREDVGPHKAPSQGGARLLVMPVEVAGHPPLDTAALTRFFGADDPDGFVQFYQTASLGRYQPQVTVGPKIAYDTCPLPEAQFPGCSVARGDIASFSAGMNMIRDVVKRTREAGFDFGTLDVNGRKGTADGWVDGVMLLTNVDFGGIAFPFAYFNQGDNLDGGTGGPLVVDGVRVGHVAIAGNGNPFVLVHEFGHVLGLTDLYDESGTYAGLHLSTMGTWGYDANITLFDAESRFRLRWGQWHQVQGTQTVRIHPAETSGDLYRVGVGDEYFLVENRGPGAFDRSLPLRGLAVYHVDRTVKLSGTEGTFVNRILDCVNCDPWHPYIALVQADGRFDVELARPFDPTSDLFGPGSSLSSDDSGLAPSKTHPVLSSNLWSGRPSGFALRDVHLLDGGDVEVTLTGPDSGQCGETLCASGDGCAPVSCEPPAPAKSGCAAAPGALVGWLGALLLEQRLRRRQQV
jgi:M6 family metalloprotease-like protein